MLVTRRPHQGPRALPLTTSRRLRTCWPFCAENRQLQGEAQNLTNLYLTLSYVFRPSLRRRRCRDETIQKHCVQEKVNPGSLARTCTCTAPADSTDVRAVQAKVASVRESVRMPKSVRLIWVVSPLFINATTWGMDMGDALPSGIAVNHMLLPIHQGKRHDTTESDRRNRFR